MTREEYLKYGVETGLLKFGEYLKLTRPLKLPNGLEEAAFAYENAQWEAGMKDCGYAPQDVAAAFKSGWMARDAQIPKLPDDVDEAAEKASKTWRRNEDGSEERELFPQTFIRGFITGAEWMAGQGEIRELIVARGVTKNYIGGFVVDENKFHSGEEVIVQIRKK